MVTEVRERYRFTGADALEQTMEFMVRIRHVKGIGSYYRSGNSVIVKLKPLPGLQERVTKIHDAVKKWAPKREYKPRKSA